MKNSFTTQLSIKRFDSQMTTANTSLTMATSSDPDPEAIVDYEPTSALIPLSRISSRKKDQEESISRLAEKFSPTKRPKLAQLIKPRTEEYSQSINRPLTCRNESDLKSPFVYLQGKLSPVLEFG